jgi:hypothetical protein
MATKKLNPPSTSNFFAMMKLNVGIFKVYEWIIILTVLSIIIFAAVAIILLKKGKKDGGDDDESSPSEGTPASDSV